MNSLIATARKKGYIQTPKKKEIPKTPHPESNEGLRQYSLGRSGITFRFYDNFSLHDVAVSQYSCSAIPQIQAQYYPDGSIPSVIPTRTQNIHNVKIRALTYHIMEKLIVCFRQGIHLSITQNGHEIIRKAFIKEMRNDYDPNIDEHLVELSLVQVE